MDGTEGGVDSGAGTSGEGGMVASELMGRVDVPVLGDACRY